MITNATHGETRSTASSPSSAVETSSLSAVVSRNEPSLLVHLPAPREPAVDEIGRRRDQEQDRGDGPIVAQQQARG